MSRQFQNKNKDLVNLEVRSAKEVWEKNKKGKYVLSSDFDYFGKVDKGLSSFVTMTNKNGVNVNFVEDTCKLTKKIKNDIVKTLNTNKTKVVYLVKKKK